MDDQPQVPYTGNDHSGLGDQVIDTAEAFVFLGIIWFLVRGMKRHPLAGVILIASTVSGIWTLLASGGTSDLAWVFWVCVVMFIISAGRLLAYR